MAQGDAWQFGIEVPIPNWKFETWDRWAYFQDTVIAGARVHTANISGTTLDLRTAANGALIDGNTVILGPSTHTNNPGATETVTISAIDIDGADYFFDSSANLEYDYMSGDPMVFRSVPQGWTPNVAGGYTANRIYSRDTGVLFGDSAIDYGIGYSAKITRESAGANIHMLSLYTKINTLLPANGVHRISAYGKGTGDTAKNYIAIDSYKSDLNVLTSNLQTINYSACSNYTLKSATFTPDGTCTRGQVKLFIATAVTGLTTFSIADLIIEHAYGIDAATGYYTAVEYADEGSIKYDKISKDTTTELVNNTTAQYDASGGRPRHWLACQFTDCNQAFYDDIAMLDKYSRQGSNIVFRPFIDDLPPVMVGKIRITDIGKQFYNLAYRSCAFRFEEV